MLKILQVRLQQYVNRERQMFKLDLQKAKEPEIKLPMDHRKSKSSRRTSASLTTLKPLTV